MIDDSTLRIICEGKLPHKKYTAAETAAKRLRRKFDKYRYQVYRCWVCQCWHVGRTDKKEKSNGNKGVLLTESAEVDDDNETPGIGDS